MAGGERLAHLASDRPSGRVLPAKATATATTTCGLIIIHRNRAERFASGRAESLGGRSYATSGLGEASARRPSSMGRSSNRLARLGFRSIVTTFSLVFASFGRSNSPGPLALGALAEASARSWPRAQQVAGAGCQDGRSSRRRRRSELRQIIAQQVAASRPTLAPKSRNDHDEQFVTGPEPPAEPSVGWRGAEISSAGRC